MTLATALLSTPLAAQTTAPAESAPTVQTPAAIRHNATIVAADGRKVGRVDRIRGDQVVVLTQGRLVSIPASTLTADGTRFKTSLTVAEIARR